MRIIFMGTPGFAVASLEILIKNKYTIVAVVTSPDKPAGRGQQIQQSPVKEFALKHGLRILQPVNLKDESFLNELKALAPDLQIVVAFRMLPESVWNLPPLGTYNIHASLLPNYRGAAPINWALINGEKESGVTSFKLKHEIDTGSILLQEKVTIGADMNAGQLHDVLMHTGAELLWRSVRKIEEGNIELVEQSKLLKSGEEAKHAPKLFKENCKIDWSKSGVSIHNLIRGLSPYPCAWTELHSVRANGTSFKIFTSKFVGSQHTCKAGHIISDKTDIKVACLNGFIHIAELQMSGKKKMPAAEFLKGFSFEENSFFA
ncbi:MAG TPA: methionyl-tRNA formyltransferase [Bacteroidia bacterium]|jgi:methionyl-tRNA formyltransferase|nr:methionyl-tRNA formyltransferase [Bacteroidia bacterium]